MGPRSNVFTDASFSRESATRKSRGRRYSAKIVLNEISHGAPQARDMYAKTVTPEGVSYFGAEVFWDGGRPARVRALDAAYYFTSDSSGLALNTGKNMDQLKGH